jgi:hypothetical protein
MFMARAGGKGEWVIQAVEAVTNAAQNAEKEEKKNPTESGAGPPLRFVKVGTARSAVHRFLLGPDASQPGANPVFFVDRTASERIT